MKLATSSLNLTVVVPFTFTTCNLSASKVAILELETEKPFGAKRPSVTVASLTLIVTGTLVLLIILPG